VGRPRTLIDSETRSTDGLLQCLWSGLMLVKLFCLNFASMSYIYCGRCGVGMLPPFANVCSMCERRSLLFVPLVQRDLLRVFIMRLALVCLLTAFIYANAGMLSRSILGSLFAACSCRYATTLQL
jgi:hypothetical protein